MTPKLSVIMTVYNGEAFLQETLDAVFGQTFTDFELVVVNNGCTDGTQAMLDGVTDDRLRVVQNPNGKTFGEGIRVAYENAQAQYLAVQDADDVPLPDRFKLQVAALDCDDLLGLVSSAFEDIDQDGRHLANNFPPTDQAGLIDAIQTHSPMAHSTYMYRKTASDQVGGYPAEYAYGPDFGLVVRLIKADWKIQVLGEILLKLRQHAGQASLASDLGVTRAHDAYHLYSEASELEGASGSARKAGRKNVTKCRVRYGLALIGENRLGKGLSHILKAVLNQPLYSSVYLGYRLGRKLRLVKPAQA
ncbi:MAG: hypothetical protein COB46_01290 [Rhodospirillaceae bacterium]|nr:MAG: hypothetical protein COB46_01290 [Rhodospirillaceae bacterium]